MKRPIKFRGRDIDTGEFRYAELGQVSAELNPEYLTFITDDAYTIDADSIAQLVGYDVDGNEVYEGDILVGNYEGADYEYVARTTVYAYSKPAGVIRNLHNVKLKEDTK